MIFPKEDARQYLIDKHHGLSDEDYVDLIWKMRVAASSPPQAPGNGWPYLRREHENVTLFRKKAKKS